MREDGKAFSECWRWAEWGALLGPPQPFNSKGECSLRTNACSQHTSTTPERTQAEWACMDTGVALLFLVKMMQVLKKTL